MKQYRQLIVAALLVAFVIIMRLVPHPANVAPVAAAALFAGAYLNKKWALAVPVIALFASDMIIGFYAPLVMVSVYGSFALVGMIGWWVRRSKDVFRIITGILASSLLFFGITNFAVWAFGSWYPHSFNGLVMSYTLALPFFRNTLFGDLLFTGMFFGIAEAVRYCGIKKQTVLPVRCKVRRAP